MRCACQNKAFATFNDGTKPICTICGGTDEPESEVLSATANEEERIPHARSIGQIYTDALEELAIPYPSIKLPSWTGFNEVMGGFRMREYTILCGQTGVGKTTLLANISHQLLLAKKRHFVASVETGSTDFVKRVISVMLRKDVNTGDAVPVEILEKVHENHGEILSGDLLQLSLYNNRIPVEVLIEDIRWMKEKKGCDIVMIDNLNFFMEVTDERKQIVEMDRVTHELIIFCKQVDVHIIMVMHPRKTEGRVNNEFDIKGSSTAVQEAHNILLFNRPHPDTIEEDKANPSDRELKFQKIRRRGKFSGMTLVLKNVNHGGVCYEEGTKFWERQLPPKKSSKR
jgi:replicative DNA helicase